MKKFDMKSICLVASVAFFFAACGDDVTNDSVVKAESYESKADMPECGEKYEGMFATVPSQKAVYACSEGSWKTILSASNSESGNFACSTVELSNGSGYKVVCGGDSVGVVKNGAKGDAGHNGSEGSKGPSGDPGTSGGNGSNGKDLTLGEGDCAVMFTGDDVVVYDCGDSAYVKNINTHKIGKAAWFDVTMLNIYNVYAYYHGAIPDKVVGKLDYFTSGTKEELWANGYYYDEKFLYKYMTFAGRASLEITEAQTVSAGQYRPYVGFEIYIDDDVKSRGGLCVTYSAEKDMGLLLEDGSDNYIRAVLPATGGKTKSMDIPLSAFEVATEGADVESVLSWVEYAYVEVVGGTAVGKLTNTFSISELRNYGKCGKAATYSDMEKYIKSLNIKKEKYSDSRTTPATVYNTVTIGEQTWFADNLRFGTEPCLLADDDDENCKNSGRKYTWLQALGDDGTNCGASTACSPALKDTVQGICPDGWHLPNIHEWGKLFALLRDYHEDRESILLFDAFVFYKAGGALTDKDVAKNLTGLGLVYETDGTGGNYWSSTETTNSNNAMTFDNDDIGEGYPYVYELRKDPALYDGYYMAKTKTLPVRCVKDAEPAATP